ncbi:MAG: hypothetical protein UT91_C0017G0019 [Parcubacteria group bacterium GW2011_GWA2_40_23]|nr:MAG: hypothetical protein UT91_C0017G0019 [Parcubacteria group bacterium GW2011_GWA2_40_23]
MNNQHPIQPNLEKIRELIGLNFDARQYFFTKVDENWLEWLWSNGLLDIIKQKAEDPTRYGYQTPELNYLARIVDRKPKEIVDIMISVPISKDNFNPEVVDQFLRICSSLPAEEVKRMVRKIMDDGWVRLMSIFNHYGFDYEKIFKTLATAKDHENILILAEAVLSVKSKEEFNQTSPGRLSENPFYFNDISYTKVFEYLVAIDEQYLEKALELATKVITKILCLGDQANKDDVFLTQETFYLFDVDFFSLELNKSGHHSDREHVKELAATIKILTERLLEDSCEKQEFVDDIYKKYIQTLPDSRSMWRLRLFVLSLCPNAFRSELKQSFSKLFEVMESGKHYYEIESGTEYKKTLKHSFGILDSDYQREYISNIFRYFGQARKDKSEEQLYRRDGWQILSSICDYLTEKEKENCEKVFSKKCDSSFEPEPSIGNMRSGFVKPRAPISQDEFGGLTINDIAQKLRNEWKPEFLQKQNTDDDFLNPLNAEGAGEQLRADVAKRLPYYVQNSDLFFERDILDEHYTYSFFRGIQEAIRLDKGKATDIQWGKLLDVFIAVKNSSITKVFDSKTRERERFDYWLSNWTGVHSTMTDVLQELLNENEGKIIIDFSKYRSQLFEIINYLLTYPDPRPQDEELETATMKTHSPGDKEEYYVTDPFSMAINTVRGRAFQLFVSFVYQDGKQFKKEDNIKITEDVKKIYEEILRKENTRALMFMFGHYLSSFYLRDKDWMHGLLAQIFSEDETKKYLYLAAWEGYLANNLYEEIYFDPLFQRLYERGLALTSNEDPKRKYFKDPDEGIAIHIALAFLVYHKRFGFDHLLFKKFWEQDIERQSAFISFIGRMFISGENTQVNEQLKKDSESKERLIKLWEWLLENYDNPKLFAEFGFWVNLEKGIFAPDWLAKQLRATLKKSNGILEWDYALTKSINELARVAPEDTLEIIRLYLLEGGIRSGKIRMPFMYEEEWSGALKTIYERANTKDNTYKLIDDLIREGGSIFWKLEEIIK